MSGEYPIRVASIPNGHPYVAHLAVPSDDGVRRLPDPPPAVPDPLPGQWWPPAVLEPGWIEQHADEIDLVHLHFGFDTATPAQLRDWTQTLRRHRLPLVFTVHDLVNPHFEDSSMHLAQLDVLVPAATELITLTAGAAADIRRRWRRRATVLPHPHVVADHRLGEPRPPHEHRVIGVHAKNLRANLDPLPVLREITAALPDLPGVRLQVDVHPEVFDPATRDPRRRLFAGWIREQDVDLRVHGRFTDDELQDYLTALDLVVLPYRFGTHSGWLEACVDVGTPVLVPAVGHYAGQHGHPAYRVPGADGPAPTLTHLLQQALADPAFALRTPPDRRAQRAELARAHRDVYDAALREFHPSVNCRVEPMPGR
jgi:hypothetical protein